MGRSAYYQPGGAFGFRDQLQDCRRLVLPSARPHPRSKSCATRASSSSKATCCIGGMRTPASACGRDSPTTCCGCRYVTAAYVQTTGDEAVLDEMAPFISGPPLAAGPGRSCICGRNRPAASATVYEHCCRALDRGLTTGPHGLPLIGCGDWNDGMNRVGQRGQGESVWLGFFIASCSRTRCCRFVERRDDRRARRAVCRLARATGRGAQHGRLGRRLVSPGVSTTTASRSARPRATNARSTRWPKRGPCSPESRHRSGPNWRCRPSKSGWSTKRRA